ncbi:hypothetical protein OZX56_08240 [Lactobacillus sp. ESL0684]|uniref:hypothetical protein n=1 Tax=unclassified Lactobacillus TaxID=2620435 RepID=UPI0023F7A424|nr:MULTISPECIES: hypothetical protein [unclassified Lactobacillus]WEV39977.1 hypothetical protein OZX59_07135 [Lactobacillus sp. ESL0681]WEV43481.1 hypothetical protein OZX56_08240 [Lactobacillus sp. ESL0684]
MDINKNSELEDIFAILKTVAPTTTIKKTTGSNSIEIRVHTEDDLIILMNLMGAIRGSFNIQGNSFKNYVVNLADFDEDWKNHPQTY